MHTALRVRTPGHARVHIHPHMHIQGMKGRKSCGRVTISPYKSARSWLRNKCANVLVSEKMIYKYLLACSGMAQNTAMVEMYGRSRATSAVLWRRKIFFERYSFGALLILCMRNLRRRTAAANYRATCVDVNKQPRNFSIRSAITEKTRVNQTFFFNRKN